LALTGSGIRPAIAEDEADLDKRIAKLITQLGDNDYDVRQRAQQELERLRFAAFDALTEAEENDDVEIATQARYLARQIRSDWIDKNDSPQVREILQDYDAQNDAARKIKMGQLLALGGDAGIEGLCRLLRFFEQSPLLAKEGAMLIITQDPQPDDANWPKRAAMLTKNLDRSRRPAARWLRTYVEMRTDPEKALASWVELVEVEKRTLEQHPQQSNSQLLMQLLRIEVAQLQRLGRDDQALAAMHEMVAIERGDPITLAELVSWLAKRQAWSVIDEVATRFAPSFEADPQLLYTRAQALAAEGKNQQAEEAADRALHLNPDRAADHELLAFVLRRRGLMEWSDREYRHIIAMKGPTLETRVNALKARLVLAESLHDRALDAEAGELMQVVIDQLDSPLESDRELNRRALAELHFRMEQRRAQTYFFQACACGQKQDFARQRELLEKGIREFPADGEVLIGLYHLPEQTPEQHEKTMELIASALQLYRNRIDEDPDVSDFYNQVAWLVANTEGDFDEAIRLSEKSVELERASLAREGPGLGEERLGGNLDTLAHCYAAKGDYAAAVKAQTEASHLIPYSQVIAKKLALFRSKLPAAEQKDAP
jgi:tetratricopeptide (TPR) repeat protein